MSDNMHESNNFKLCKHTIIMVMLLNTKIVLSNLEQTRISTQNHTKEVPPPRVTTLGRGGGAVG